MTRCLTPLQDSRGLTSTCRGNVTQRDQTGSGPAALRQTQGDTHIGNVDLLNARKIDLPLKNIHKNNYNNRAGTLYIIYNIQEHSIMLSIAA